MGGVGPPQSLRVLVAYADTAERDAAVEVFRAVGMDVVAVCSTGDAAVRAALETRPDVCVLDVALPDCAALTAAETILAACPGVGVVVVAGPLTEVELAEAILAGAHAYVDRTADLAQLAATVNAVAGGHVSYPQLLMQGLLGSSAA
jgi:DNA-binding NarL/FixJ family response regulator